MLVTLGRSVEGTPIQAYLRPHRHRSPTIMILGGFHGDEPKGVTLARKLIAVLAADGSAGGDDRWVIVDVVNPDGYERRKRRNAAGVDLNRNFPTANWVRNSPRSRMFAGDEPASEPETRAVMKAVKTYRPSRIISIHSIGGGRECNNYDGPGRAVATKMRRFNGYRVTASIGYPTPGSLGTWAGVERGIPTITLELPSRHSPKRCWEDNRKALLYTC